MHIWFLNGTETTHPGRFPLTLEECRTSLTNLYVLAAGKISDVQRTAVFLAECEELFLRNRILSEKCEGYIDELRLLEEELHELIAMEHNGLHSTNVETMQNGQNFNAYVDLGETLFRKEVFTNEILVLLDPSDVQSSLGVFQDYADNLRRLMESMRSQIWLERTCQKEEF